MFAHSFHFLPMRRLGAASCVRVLRRENWRTQVNREPFGSLGERGRGVRVVRAGSSRVRFGLEDLGGPWIRVGLGALTSVGAGLLLIQRAKYFA